MAAGECDLPGVGLHFDQVNEVSVLEPDVAEQTNQLAEECKEFMTSQFNRIFAYCSLSERVHLKLIFTYSWMRAFKNQPA